MRFSPKFWIFVITVLAGAAAFGQGGRTYNVGRTPTNEEIRAADTAIGPSGKGLPLGRGTVKEGEKIYAQKCASCHGPTGAEGGLGPRLVGGKGTLTSGQPVKTIGSYWPFATSLWDYLNRGMPLNQQGTLTPAEVYALTAVLLHWNGIIKETEVMDAQTLPKVQMPNRNGFVPQSPAWKTHLPGPFGIYP